MKKAGQDDYINEVSEEEIVSQLSIMQNDPAYLTESYYRGASERWTDNKISFVDYHLNYMKVHPTLDPAHYISNLRLKLRKTSL